MEELAKQLPENIKQKEQAAINFDNSAEVDTYLQKEFSGVLPSPKDFFKGKLYAYKIAAERLKKNQEEKASKERWELFTRMWTAQEMAKNAIENGKAIGLSEGFDFVIDEKNKYVFDLLCLYFTNDPRFENYGIGDKKYSLNKGIWLQSPTRGTGKSVMLRCFYINKRSCYGYKHTTELAVLFQKRGFEAIDYLIGLLPQPASPLNFYQNEIGFMYDELFGEEKVNHMGSPLSISGYIINKLYDFSNSIKNKKWKFHCTSNADGADIEVMAGKNYRSRMADMFNLIKLEGEDRRK